MEFLPRQQVMPETSIQGAPAHLPEDFDAVIAAMAAGAYDTAGWVDVVSLEGVETTIAGLRAGRGTKALVSSN